MLEFFHFKSACMVVQTWRCMYDDARMVVHMWWRTYVGTCVVVYVWWYMYGGAYMVVHGCWHMCGGVCMVVHISWSLYGVICMVMHMWWRVYGGGRSYFFTSYWYFSVGKGGKGTVSFLLCIVMTNLNHFSCSLIIGIFVWVGKGNKDEEFLISFWLLNIWICSALLFPLSNAP